jgi:signal peptidase I
MKNSTHALDVKHTLQCELATEVLRSSGSVRMRVTGWSMLPVLWPGDTLVIERVNGDAVSEGDIVLFTSGRRFVAHRVMIKDSAFGESKLQTKGDAVSRPDSPVAHDDLLGRVSSIVRNGKSIAPSRHLCFSERAVATVFQRSEIAARVVVGVHNLRQTSQA